MVSGNVMEMSRTTTLLFLATHVTFAEANMNDPTFCYVLDVFLLIYSIIFTALYFRERFTRGPVLLESTARNPNEPVYTDLDLPQMSSDYQQIRRREPETHYQELRGQTNDEYKEIRSKPRKGKNKHEGRTARKRDVAEAVEMETFPTGTSHN